MSRLPDLEHALLTAAQRLEDADATAAATTELRRARRWRRASPPLLAGLASLLVAGGAVAAFTGLLDNGDPVPASPDRSLRPLEGFQLTSLRVEDPEGGPPWTIGTFTADPSDSSLPPGFAGQASRKVTCVVVGRTQNGQFGVVGRDGVFADDGRFHRLSPATQSSGVCAGKTPDGAFQAASSGPPRPASGYSGAPGPPVGGCRERGNLNRPTVSPQTRKRLRNVPQCSTSSLRHVVSGFAGPDAVRATIDGPGGPARTLNLRREENGAYLFILRSKGIPRPKLTITKRDGRRCNPFPATPADLRTACT